MRFALAVFSIAFLSALVPPVQAQTPGGIRWDASSPGEVRRNVSDLFLNDTSVRVVLEDGTSLEGKIEGVGSDDFTMAWPPSARATIDFAGVRGISWKHRNESRAGRIRSRVREMAARPNLVVTVRPRQQLELIGRIATVRELSFVLVEETSGIARELGYRDLDRITAPGFPSDPAASDRAKDVALLLAGVVFLPLTILMRLIEWDGC